MARTRIERATRQAEEAGFAVVVRRTSPKQRGCSAHLPGRRYTYSLKRGGSVVATPRRESEFLALIEGLTLGRSI